MNIHNRYEDRHISVVVVVVVAVVVVRKIVADTDKNKAFEKCR